MPQTYEFSWVFTHCYMWIFSGTMPFPLLKLVFLQFRFKEHLLNNCTFQLRFHTSLVMVVFILIDKKTHIQRVSDLLEATQPEFKPQFSRSEFWSTSPFSQVWLHNMSYYWLFWGVLFLATEWPFQLIIKKSLKLFKTCSISDADHALGRKGTQPSLWDFIYSFMTWLLTKHLLYLPGCAGSWGCSIKHS